MYKWDEMTEQQRDSLVVRTFELPYNIIDFQPTCDMSDAWEVLNKLPSFYHRHVTYHGASTFKQADWVCGISLPPEGWWSAWSDSAPEAICKAALKAVGIDIE